MHIEKLSESLVDELENANEVWVAVGLLNRQGLQKILKRLPADSTLHFLIGIDLPSEPKAMKQLLSLAAHRNISAHVVARKGVFFHPKVYIIRSQDSYTAYVGSANCTMGGFEKNIEISLRTQNESTCAALVKWFADTRISSMLLTTAFIKRYEPLYEKRICRKSREEAELKPIKESLEISLSVQLLFRKRFENELREFRRSKSYAATARHREEVVQSLRVHLDYPNFEKIDLDGFFEEKSLGTIHRRFVEPYIIKNPKRFKALLRSMCDEDVPVATRMNEGLEGKFSLPQVKLAFLSKILVVHRPEAYYLHNEISEGCLQEYGLVNPKGASLGRKYQLANELLLQIRTSVRIENFAVLDEALWQIRKS